MDFSTSPLPATVLAARLNLTGLATSAITGTLTLTKTGTTARTATFPDAAITVAGSASALTSGRVPYVTTGGLLTDAAILTISGSTLSIGDGSAACVVQASASVSTSPEFRWLRGGNIRWRAFLSGTESGSDTGGSWFLRAATDAGVTIDDPISIVRAAGGAITLARPVTCTGAVTVPNGTAAAPGIRTTTYAHGLYSIGATSVGISVAGALELTIGSTASSLAAGSIFTFSDTTDATTTSDGSVRLSGGLSVAKSCVIGGTAGNFLNIANSTGELRVNGTKVVTAQGAAVADATGAGDVVAQLNALLARCRAHGLIAT